MDIPENEMYPMFNKHTSIITPKILADDNKTLDDYDYSGEEPLSFALVCFRLFFGFGHGGAIYLCQDILFCSVITFPPYGCFTRFCHRYVFAGFECMHVLRYYCVVFRGAMGWAKARVCVWM